jgi:nucleoside-diphosphate-sugar epimerase
MKHILVTGGCGYVGTPLVASLLEAGHRVTAFDAQWFGNHLPAHPALTVVTGDIRQTEAIPLAEVDAVIHLANIANDPCSELNARVNWEVNTLATMTLMERALAHGVGHFIYASSGSVYGVRPEDEVTEDLPLVPISDYNKTKMISERVLLSYADRLAITMVRPATICGFSPRMRLDLSVNMLTWQALTRGKITVFGGDQTRPNIHLRDMIGVYHHVLDRGAAMAGIYNAGFENLSVMDIARRVTDRVPAEIVVSPSNDPRSYRLSSRKLLSTGFTPRFSVDEGISEVIEAHRQGLLPPEDDCHNLRVMKKLPGFAAAP